MRAVRARVQGDFGHMPRECRLAYKTARKAIENQLAVISAHGSMLPDENPDSVHDVRVATRRLRAIFTEFRTSMKKGRRRAAQAAVRQITCMLGKARELDVSIELLESIRKDTRGTARYAANHVIRTLRARRAAENATLTRTAELATAPSFSAEVAGVLDGGARRDVCYAAEVVEATAKRYAELLRAYDLWHTTPSDALLHEVRIAFKKMRYACELHRKLYGQEMEALIAGVRQAQDALGDWHDLSVIRNYVAEALPSAPPRAAQGMPELTALLTRSAERHLTEFRRCSDTFFSIEAREKTHAILANPEHKCCRTE